MFVWKAITRLLVPRRDNLDQASEKENKVDGGHCLVKGHTEPAQNNLQQSKRMCLAIGIIIVISIGMLGITSPN